jgi:hypothetical protein
MDIVDLVLLSQILTGIGIIFIIGLGMIHSQTKKGK